MEQTPVFTYQQFQQMLEQFTQALPPLLTRMPETADLARQVDALLDIGESPFTVAVMGQMRSGKSTLLNALIGRDLAVTGVNETTATINWFKYATEAPECDRFRVAWKDAPEESLPLARLQEWSGDSQVARRTRHLEFFAQSEFLRTANIVDTPGTRSVIQDHTSAISEFIHNESVRQGGKADAIIYVMMPVGRENDEKWLSEFEQNTRLPGSSPYNSLAVVHKWEMMLDVEDPAAVAEQKTATLREKLAGKISCVLPVSAPLAICSQRLCHDDFFWQSLWKLGRNSTEDAFNLVTMQEEYYELDTEGCALTVTERTAMRERVRSVYPGFPWASFKLMIRTARRTEIASPAALRARIDEMSGFGRLKSELEARYFARSNVIKAFSILAKAWVPCQTAQTRLGNLKKALDQTMKAGEAAQRILEERIPGDQSLKPVLEYVRQSHVTLDTRFRAAQGVLMGLANVVSPVQMAYEDMERELSALERLELLRKHVTPELYQSLHCLLGGAGPEIENRLKSIPAGDATADDLANLCEQLRGAQHRLPAEAKKLLDIAIMRAEQLADWLDAAAEAAGRA